jgi:hypothetical protein
MKFSALWLNELSRLVKQHPLLHKACLSRGGKNPCALGIEHPDQITRDSLAGGVFENMVIIDLLKRRMNCVDL